MQRENIEKGEFSLPIEGDRREKKCEEQTGSILLQLQKGADWEEEPKAWGLHSAKGDDTEITQEWEQTLKFRDIQDDR